MGVMGDTDGFIGDRLVGEVTLKPDRLSDNEVDCLESTILDSLSGA